VVSATAWGPGADWLLERVPTLLGERDADDWAALDLSAHPWLADLLHRLPGLRLPSTGRVLEALVPAVLEQRVTGSEARRSWRGLLYRFGTPAPGPLEGLRIQPDAATLLDIPTWDWHRLGVELARQRPIRAAATVAGRLEECVDLTPAQALARLRILPGVGEWTAAETAQRAIGHPDAVSVGDYHLKDVVVHALTGRPRGSDAEMIELLAPWAGHRHRVVRLIELSGVAKPRFGPRYSPLDFRAI
jgi:3-methyladenine DNA glycosylase/8-oxoguanine DNA glycosylase